tara:strand:+ start:97012 stop:98568 length:1557 start_codon:yes stop_codon:yes gene_type:complete
MNIKIAARQSDLARIQAYAVGDALKSKHPHLNVDYLFSKSAGDKDQESLLRSMGDKGVFTNDFYEGLCSGEFDMVVHSWKDMPTESREKTSVACTMKREDPRDILLFKKSHLRRFRGNQGGDEVTVLTSSPRREHNIKGFIQSYFPLVVEDVLVEPIRGNIQTRVDKFLKSNADGMMIAKAALDRLMNSKRPEFESSRASMKKALESCHFMVLPLNENPGAAAQGALAVEIASQRADLKDLLQAIHHERHFACVLEERKILASYGGGCHQKIGVTVVPHEQGEVVFQKGISDSGVVLDGVEQKNSKLDEMKVPKKLTEIFPLDTDNNLFFDRSELPISIDELAMIESEETGLYVARANGLPEDFRYNDQQCVWASGVETWKKLAQKGIWVNGCDDGLGSRRLPAVDYFYEKKLKWMKLTHNQSFNAGPFKLFYTYQLVPKAETPNLANKKYFYWMSGTQFKLAYENYPHIVDGYHFCGTGITYQEIKSILSGRGTVIQFYSFKNWKQWMFNLLGVEEI